LGAGIPAKIIRRLEMIECNQCGTEFFNEFEPLSTICESCKEEYSTEADAYWQQYIDWVEDKENDTSDPLIQYEDGWR
jgi:hypothetical protein